MFKYIKILLSLILFSYILPNMAIADDILTWQDCIKEAAKNHPDLISAKEAVKESEASKKITASTLYPQVTGNAEVSTAKTSTTTSGTTTNKTSNDYTYGATASQLIFDGFKTIENVKAASENIKAAQYDYVFTSSEVRQRLRTAFIALLKAQDSLNITQDIYNIRRSDFELISLRYQSGVEHKGALLNADANLDEAVFEINQAKRSVVVAQTQLLKEMGNAQFRPIHVKGDYKIKIDILEQPDFEKLAKNNPSLEKLVAQKNAASFGIKAAQANYFPQISAQAGANKDSSHWPPDNNQWNAGLALSIPVFEGGLRTAEVAQAKAIFNQAQANEQSIKDGLLLALEQTWTALQDAAETVSVQKKFLDSAQERANIAEAQYSLGLLQFDNWTIIEDNLVNAKKSFLNSQANALVTEANWIQAKGETLEYEK